MNGVSDGQGYGYRVWIKNENGNYSAYGHLQADSSEFKRGQSVKAGQIIGRSGNTGLSDGPHLHYEERKMWSDKDSHIRPIRIRSLYDLKNIIC